MPILGRFGPASTDRRVVVGVRLGGAPSELLVLLVFGVLGVLLVFGDFLSIGHGEEVEDGMVRMRRTADTATKGSLLPGLRVNFAVLSQNGYGPSLVVILLFDKNYDQQ